METPSNLLTPTVFADTLINRFSDLESVEVLARYLIHISLLLNSYISLCIYFFNSITDNSLCDLQYVHSQQ